MNNYKTTTSFDSALFEAVEEAIFHAQCKDTREVLNYIRNVAKIREFQDWKEIDKLIHVVATQYRRRVDQTNRRYS
jgi:hypothetical protein